METAARGMLRRPVGLLPSTTTRAEKDPAVMGSTAVQAGKDHSSQEGAVEACTHGGQDGGTRAQARQAEGEAITQRAIAQGAALTSRAAVQEASREAWTPVAHATSLASQATGISICAGIGAPLVVAHAQLVRQEGEAAATVTAPLVHATPMVTGQEISEARQALPWGEAVHAIVVGGGASAEGDAALAAVQRRSEAVDAARASALARKQITHYKCMSCRTLVPNEEMQCPKCEYTRGDAGALALAQREQDRAASRQNSYLGRRRNKCAAATVPAHSLEVVVNSPFEREWTVQMASKKQRVVQETQELALARCGEGYVNTEDSHACVFESFLQVCEWPGAVGTHCKMSTTAMNRRV